MSNAYFQEQPTHGKLLLETTAGDIDIELLFRDCPMGCRDFIQLCIERYFDITVFHRLVEEFIAKVRLPRVLDKGAIPFGETLSRNYKLLSFGAEAEEEEKEVAMVVKKWTGKNKSSHDLTNDPKLSSEVVAVTPSKSSSSTKSRKRKYVDNHTKTESSKSTSSSSSHSEADSGSDSNEEEKWETEKRQAS